MPKPSEYKWIAVWGWFMGSEQYYIKAEQERAAADNAPLDAIYMNYQFPDGRSAPTYNEEEQKKYGIKKRKLPRMNALSTCVWNRWSNRVPGRQTFV